jgi:hypothetical protein
MEEGLGEDPVNGPPQDGDIKEVEEEVKINGEG